MTLINRLIISLLVMFSPIDSIASPTVAVKANVNYVLPSCSIGLPTLINLGAIKKGLNIYDGFQINIDCPISMHTAIIAKAGSLKVGSNNELFLSEGVGLFIKTTGNYISLNGTEQFCTGYNNRACNLKVETHRGKAKAGKVSGVITFTVKYFL